MSDRREQLLEIIEDAAKGETKATLRAELAALRAAVPEVEPVGVRCTGCGSSWDDDRLAEEKSKRPELISCCPERKIVPLYTHPAPRPDMERELAEARAERDAANDAWRKMKDRAHSAEAERDTLAADKAWLVEALGKLEKAATVVSRHGAQTGSWWSDLTTGLIYAPADKAEARREALIEHLRSEFSDSYDCTRVWEAWSYNTMTEDDFEPITDRLGEIADGMLALISTPARREGE